MCVYVCVIESETEGRARKAAVITVLFNAQNSIDSMISVDLFDL